MTAVADRAVVLDGATVPSREVVGNKGRSIAWMLSLGLPVPPALCLPIEECRRFHAAGGELEDEAWSRSSPGSAASRKSSAAASATASSRCWSRSARAPR